jgi:hypothetical protein
MIAQAAGLGRRIRIANANRPLSARHYSVQKLQGRQRINEGRAGLASADAPFVAIAFS